MPFSDLLGGDALVDVMEAASTALLAVGPDGVIEYANPGAAAAFGYDPEELVGRSVEVLVPADVAEAHSRVRHAYAEEPAARGMGVGMDLQARRKDGTTFPVEIALTPVTSAAGGLVIANVVDISMRLAAERSERSLGRAHLAMAELNDAAARAQTAEELLEAARFAFTTIDATTSALVIPGTREPGRSVGGGTVLAADVEAAIAAVRTDRRPRFGPSTAVHGRVGILPVERGNRLEACVVVESDGEMLDEPAVRTVLETMATNLSLALERLDHRVLMEHLDAQRIELLRRLVLAEEKERNRIAEDVHDDSVQALAALQLKIGLLQQRVAVDASDLAPALDHVQDELVRVMATLRTLLFELEPVEGGRLLDVVQDVLDRAPVGDLAVRGPDVVWSGVPDAVRDDGLVELPVDLLAQAARILKEAVHNVVKHARATTLEVVVVPDAVGVGIDVVDDGVGFPAAADELRSAPGHRGLISIRDRATLAGGWARLERSGGHTTLRFWLPRAGESPGRWAQDEVAPTY